MQEVLQTPRGEGYEGWGGKGRGAGLRLEGGPGPPEGRGWLGPGLLQAGFRSAAAVGKCLLTESLSRGVWTPPPLSHP